MNQKNRLYAGASIALVAAAALGFGAARLTAPTPAAPKEDSKPAPADSVAMSAQAIEQSQIAVAPVMAGELDAAVMASATVEAMPDAQAVLTAHAPGTVTRIFKRIGDPVRAETLLLVESRDASQIAGDRSAAAARVALAGQQAAREKALVAQGVSARADYETAQANLAVARPI
jgi:cobalt-zinc-cadmium efflux system membrane fusion protein